MCIIASDSSRCNGDITLTDSPQSIPIRAVRRLLKGRERIEVAVEFKGYALLCRISKKELLRTLRRAWRRGAREVPVSDLMGILVVG